MRSSRMIGAHRYEPRKGSHVWLRFLAAIAVKLSLINFRLESIAAENLGEDGRDIWNWWRSASICLMSFTCSRCPCLAPKFRFVSVKRETLTRPGRYGRRQTTRTTPQIELFLCLPCSLSSHRHTGSHNCRIPFSSTLE